ncbi:MAG: ABC transporter permease [Eubacteriaceae bacterium]
MGVLYKLTLQHLKGNKKRTLATIIGVVISAALICGTAILAFSFQDMFIRNAIKNYGNYHAVFYDVPVEKAKYITQNDYIEQSRMSNNIGYALIDSKNEYKPYLYIKAYDETSFEQQPIQLIKGRFPQNTKEIIISEHLRSNGNVNFDIGDEVTLHIGKRVDKNCEMNQSYPFIKEEVFQEDEVKTYTVTGVIERPNFEPYSAPGYTAITLLDIDSFTDGDVVNISIIANNPKDIYIRAPEIAQKANLEMIANVIGEEEYNISYNTELLRYMGISNDKELLFAIYFILLIILILIAVGSITVIYNAFTISITERKRQFAMLVSVGATPRQISKSVLLEGFIVAIIGIPIGIIAGIIGIKITLLFANDFISQISQGREEIQMIVSPLVMLITVICTGFIIFISARKPAIKAAKISPVEALRLNDDINCSGKNIKTGRITKLFGIEGQIAHKSLKRNKKKYRTTIFSIFISVVMFISFNGFMLYTTQASLTSVLGYDLSISIDYKNKEEIETIKQISKMEEINEIVSITNQYCVVHTTKENINNEALKEIFEELKNDEKIDGDDYDVSVSIYTLGEEQFDIYLEDLNADKDRYYNVDSPAGILINTYEDYMQVDDEFILKEMEVFNIDEGDWIEISQEKESEDNNANSVEICIDKISKKLPKGIVNYEPVIIVSNEIFDNIIETFDDNYIHSQVHIKSDNVSAIEKAVISQYKEAGLKEPNYYNVEEAEKSDRMMIQLIGLFCYGFITLITLIGITNIFNTIATNIQLRNKEFAILQSVGLTPKGLDKILFYESALYGIKALSYGIPVSMIISYLLFYIINGGIANIPFAFPWTAIVISVVGVFAIVFSTMMYAASKTKHESLIDVIRKESV